MVVGEISIHPEYVARSQNASPYPLSSHNSSPHLASLQIAEKSLSDSAPARLARRSHPRPSPHRSSRPSPRARASLAAKLEATRKLCGEQGLWDRSDERLPAGLLPCRAD